MRILLVEDDPILGSQIKGILCEREHVVTWMRTVQDIRVETIDHSFDAIIMDIVLPGKNGVDAVGDFRAAGVVTPVIFLSALVGVLDRVRGLRAGGDDYLTKPFDSEELLARLESISRRTRKVAGPMGGVKGWTFDPVKRRIQSATGTLELQPREWALLKALLQAQGTLLTKHYLLENVWDIHFDPGTNVVDAMICKLRGKLESLGGAARIETIRGKGYVFTVTS